MASHSTSISSPSGENATSINFLLYFCNVGIERGRMKERGWRRGKKSVRACVRACSTACVRKRVRAYLEGPHQVSLLSVAAVA